MYFFPPSTHAARRLCPSLLSLTTLVMLISSISCSIITLALNSAELSLYNECVTAHSSVSSDCWVDVIFTTTTVDASTFLSVDLISATASTLSSVRTITAIPSSTTSESSPAATSMSMSAAARAGTPGLLLVPVLLVAFLVSAMYMTGY